MTLPYKRYTESIHLGVNGAGGVAYSELELDGITTCRHLSNDQMDSLARFWSNETLAGATPRCGPGYAFYQKDDRRACRESLPGLVERRFGELPIADIEYFRSYYRSSGESGEGVDFIWDTESPLPEELERAFTGTLGLLCAEGRRLARRLRRTMPELADRAGC